MSNPTPTTITTAYNNLITLLATTLPDHKRISRPEALELSDAATLKNGWGLHVQSGTPDPRNICPNYYYNRTFEITLTKESIGKDSDVVKREQCKLWLLEDLHLVMAALARDNNLSDSVTHVSVVSDAGPEEQTINDAPYVTLDLTINVRYQQQVSGGV